MTDGINFSQPGFNKPITVRKVTKAERIGYLIAQYVRKTITEEEDCELGEWVGAHEKNIKLFQEMTDPVKIKKALELLNGK